MISRRGFIASLLTLPLVGKALVAAGIRPAIAKKEPEYIFESGKEFNKVNYDGRTYLFSSNAMYYVKDGHPPVRVEWKADN